MGEVRLTSEGDVATTRSLPSSPIHALVIDSSFPAKFLATAKRLAVQAVDSQQRGSDYRHHKSYRNSDSGTWAARFRDLHEISALHLDWLRTRTTHSLRVEMLLQPVQTSLHVQQVNK